MLGRSAAEVRLASDGRDHYMLRFEVARGELQGARIALSSDHGVISAVAVQGPTFNSDMTVRLEQALESARLSLEERGIDVAEVEVRAGSDGSSAGRQESWRDEASGGGYDDSDSPPIIEPARRSRSTTSSLGDIDYFV